VSRYSPQNHEGLPEIETLLQQYDRQDNPLYEPLQCLYHRYREQQRILDRLVRIADQFQLAERERGHQYQRNYQRQARQLEKIIRISDHYHKMMRDLNQRLHILSTHDELTGLANRRYGTQRLEQEVNVVNRNGGTFCIALADIDHFKIINDTHGHAVGDKVLTQVAQCLRTHIRDYDLCARWGGEEFMILFARASVVDAQPLAERLRAAVSQPLPTELATVTITISLGVTEYRAGDSLDKALIHADQALYQAKASGRNQVVFDYSHE
jgi:diguanylate cyclase (GGDEF)-like protein